MLPRLRDLFPLRKNRISNFASGKLHNGRGLAASLSGGPVLDSGPHGRGSTVPAQVRDLNV